VSERRLAAVVVNYNAASTLAGCVTSLRANDVQEVVVVDNGSTDRSRVALAAADPDARWVPSGGNIGYGRAANLGAAQVLGADLLICNPDLIVGPGAVATLARHLDAAPSTGLVGPLLRNPDGSRYPSARTFPDMTDAVGHGLLGMVAPDNRYTRRYRLLDWDHAAAAEVDWVSGACFLARRDAWDDVGGFDPSFFMYMEDVDLCWRLHRAGWSVGYQPAAEVTHIQGVSANQHPYRMLGAHHASMWRFARRTTGGSRRVFLPLIGVGLAARFVVAAAVHRRGVRRAGPAAHAGPLP
jgi:N-acetylglucosaminyl-diphospho-decaprenol L-rhamnosyltransferase